MTDDKGAGDGPYYVTDEYCNEVGGRRFVIRGPGLNAQTTASLIREELVGSARIRNRAYAAGRKAERERCAKIADGYFHARGRVVAKAIRGGQDAK
jgi:hypothetical protein